MRGTLRRRRTAAAGDALRLLSRSADNARVWAGIAAGLALSGGRFRRRAALRGVLSAALGSAAAGGLARRLSGTGRGFGRRRAAPSLPSSAAASGFAFAVGAGQEVPAVAAPLVGLAALVAYSRVHTGGHEPSQAAAGAVLGVGAAVVTRRLWPVAPHEPAHVRRALSRAEVEPSPTGKGLVVVINPSAGSSGKAADELRAELPDAEVVELEEGGDLAQALRDAADRGCALGVAGGDGSINAAAAVAGERGMPLFVVPGGTLNHFAFALGLEEIADAARAVREGRVVCVDRGRIDGHTFVNTASVGSYVELVDAREKLEQTIGKWPAVVVALFRVLRKASPMELEIDGERLRVWMVFVGNCKYHPAGFAPSWRERLDDGLLDVRIVDGSRPLSRLRLLLSVMTGRLARCGAYEQRWVRSLHVKSLEGRLRLARDGETFDGPEEFTITKGDDPLVIYVPEP